MFNTKRLGNTLLNITTIDGREYDRTIKLNESEITQLFVSSSANGGIDVYGVCV